MALGSCVLLPVTVSAWVSITALEGQAWPSPLFTANRAQTRSGEPRLQNLDLLWLWIQRGLQRSP